MCAIKKILLPAGFFIMSKHTEQLPRCDSTGISIPGVAPDSNLGSVESRQSYVSARPSDSPSTVQRGGEKLDSSFVSTNGVALYRPGTLRITSSGPPSAHADKQDEKLKKTHDRVAIGEESIMSSRHHSAHSSNPSGPSQQPAFTTRRSVSASTNGNPDGEWQQVRTRRTQQPRAVAVQPSGRTSQGPRHYHHPARQGTQTMFCGETFKPVCGGSPCRSSSCLLVHDPHHMVSQVPPVFIVNDGDPTRICFHHFLFIAKLANGARGRPCRSGDSCPHYHFATIEEVMQSTILTHEAILAASESSSPQQIIVVDTIAACVALCHSRVGHAKRVTRSDIEKAMDCLRKPEEAPVLRNILGWIHRALISMSEKMIEVISDEGRASQVSVLEFVTTSTVWTSSQFAPHTQGEYRRHEDSLSMLRFFKQVTNTLNALRETDGLPRNPQYLSSWLPTGEEYPVAGTPRAVFFDQLTMELFNSTQVCNNAANVLVCEKYNIPFVSVGKSEKEHRTNCRQGAHTPQQLVVPSRMQECDKSSLKLCDDSAEKITMMHERFTEEVNNLEKVFDGVFAPRSDDGFQLNVGLKWTAPAVPKTHPTYLEKMTEFINAITEKNSKLKINGMEGSQCRGATKIARELVQEFKRRLFGLVNKFKNNPVLLCNDNDSILLPSGSFYFPGNRIVVGDERDIQRQRNEHRQAQERHRQKKLELKKQRAAEGVKILTATRTLETEYCRLSGAITSLKEIDLDYEFKRKTRERAERIHDHAANQFLTLTKMSHFDKMTFDALLPIFHFPVNGTSAAKECGYTNDWTPLREENQSEVEGMSRKVAHTHLMIKYIREFAATVTPYSEPELSWEEYKAQFHQELNEARDALTLWKKQNAEALEERLNDAARSVEIVQEELLHVYRKKAALEEHIASHTDVTAEISDVNRFLANGLSNLQSHFDKEVDRLSEYVPEGWTLKDIGLSTVRDVVDFCESAADGKHRTQDGIIAETLFCAIYDDDLTVVNNALDEFKVKNNIDTLTSQQTQEIGDGVVYGLLRRMIRSYVVASPEAHRIVQMFEEQKRLNEVLSLQAQDKQRVVSVDRSIKEIREKLTRARKTLAHCQTMYL